MQPHTFNIKEHLCKQIMDAINNIIISTKCICLKCFIFVPLLIISGCTTSEKYSNKDGITSYSISLDSFKEPQLNNIFSSIEIDIMELSDQSIVGSPFHGKHYIHVENKYHIFIDNRYVINIFNIEGRFIASSTQCIGEGPQQYQILQEANYNRYTDAIDVLDPFGNITSYDLSFNFVSKYNIKLKSKEQFSHFYPVSQSSYALIDKSEQSKVYIYNSLNEKAKELNYEGTIAQVSANVSPFREHNGLLYFYPPEINNNIFIFNSEQQALSKVINIESPDCLNGSDIKSFKGDLEQVSSYIMNDGDKYTPINRFVSNQYIYTQLVKGSKPYINILNTSTGKSFSFLKDPLFKKNIPNCQYINGDTMYAIIQPHEINDFMDETLLTNNEILALISEDGNPLVVKYKLKI